MDTFAVVVGVFGFAFGGIAMAAGGFLFIQARKERQRAKEIRQQTRLMHQEANAKAEIFRNLVDEISDFTGSGYAEFVNPNLIVVYPNDSVPSLDGFVLAMIRNRLNGRCAYRDIVTQLQTYNDTVLAAGEEKLRLSEHHIRRIINRCTFAKENNWPIIVFRQAMDNGRKSEWDHELGRFVIIPTTTRGGYSKVMISLDELLERASGRVAKVAAKNRFPAQNSQLSAANVV